MKILSDSSGIKSPIELQEKVEKFFAPNDQRIIQAHAKRFEQALKDVQEYLNKPLPEGLRKMADLIPEQSFEGYAIQHYEIADREAFIANLKVANEGTPEMAVAPGRYCRLMVPRGNGDSVLMMSDTHSEINTNRDLLEKSNGDVLIAGLGIGMVLFPLFHNPEVRSVTIVEKSLEVIRMVWPNVAPELAKREQKNSIMDWWDFVVSRDHLGMGPITFRLVNADIFRWRPQRTRKWDSIYLDIWPNIGKSNLPEMEKLRSKYEAFLNTHNPKAWIASWAEENIRAQERKMQTLASDVKENLGDLLQFDPTETKDAEITRST